MALCSIKTVFGWKTVARRELGDIPHAIYLSWLAIDPDSHEARSAGSQSFQTGSNPRRRRTAAIFRGRTFVADLELTSSQNILAILKFRRNDATAHGAMQIARTLTSVAAGLRVAAGAHHRDA